MLQQNGHAIRPQLLYKLTQARVPDSEKQAVQNGAWGLAYNLARDRLDEMHKERKDRKLKEWMQKVSDVPGACQWVRQKVAQPVILKTPDDEVLTSRVKIVEHLADCWGPIFGQADGAQSWIDFRQMFHNVIPDRQDCPPLPSIGRKEIRRRAARISAKATGLDGVSARMLSQLPDHAIDRLIDMLHQFEEEGSWPEELLQWKLVFLPKVAMRGKIPLGNQLRPISIGPVIYRVWSAVRLQHVRGFLSQFLLPNQAGFQGPGVQDLLLSFELEYTAPQFPMAAALDFSKAFDSTDHVICTNLLSTLGTPPQIVRLLEAQWGNHVKWITAGGAVSHRQLRKTQGLPQGDSWSPVCMSLVLSIAAHHVARCVPRCQQLLYIDDRTVLAPDRNSLMTALEAWESLYEVTRLRNNQDKQQFLARTPAAFADLMMHGFPVSCSAEILGVTVGLVPRPLSVAEHHRHNKVADAARHISVLPGSHKLKTAVAACVLGPARAWGLIFNCRMATVAEVDQYKTLFRTAVKGWEHKHGHDMP